MFGFVDESMRQEPTGLYVVALTVVEDLEEGRRAARSLLLPRQPRIHWRDEAEPRRLAMLANVAATSTRVVAYACAMTKGKQERARALCLHRLLWDLRQSADVHQLTLESRGPASDQKDRRTVLHAQKAARAPSPSGMRYQFARPWDEPLLWLPDAVAGAVATELTGDDRGYLKMLGADVEVVEVNP